jgi:V/A-type H+-transporting ATPase subunit D
MELSRFIKRLNTSREAHKLLKDKQDELVRRFIELLRETSEIRQQVNSSIKTFATQAGLSVAGFPYKMVENLFLNKEIMISADIRKKSWMGVPVADINFDVKEVKPSSALISSPLLSKTEHDMRMLLPLLLKLTVDEKNCYILSTEIESLRRRVNALEHIIIPNLIKNIRTIRMKLSDSERENITRLIKVKTLKI